MPDNKISILDINAEISESILFEREPSSISGGISYQNNNLFITNPITLTIGPSIVSIKGEADFDNRSMNLDLSLTEASTFLINNFALVVNKASTMKGAAEDGSPGIFMLKLYRFF